MVTVREVIIPHHLKEDDTWNIKIGITHQRNTVYIDTKHFVGSKQAKKDFTIKDKFILNLIGPTPGKSLLNPIIDTGRLRSQLAIDCYAINMILLTE